MATIVVVFKILFLVLIAHNSFVVTLPEQTVLIKQNETKSVDSGSEELRERFERTNLTNHELASTRIEEGEKWWPSSDLRILSKRHNKGHSNSEELGNTSNDGEDEDSTLGKEATAVSASLESPRSSSQAPQEESAVIVEEEVGTNRTKVKVLPEVENKEWTPLPLDRRLGDTASKWLEVSSSSDDTKFKSLHNEEDEATLKDIEREPSISIPISSTTPSTTAAAMFAARATTSTAATTTASATNNADGLEDRRDQVNYAELCYLSNGGSSLTLTVNEATQVGAIIGTVEVNGDPALDGGNVDLFVASADGTPIQAQAAQQRNSSGESGSSEAPSKQQLRLLGRETRIKRETMGEFGSRRGGQIIRESRNMIASSAPPPSQLEMASPSATLGLVNDYQLSNPSAGASFYSLVASTANPSFSSSLSSSSLSSLQFTGPIIRLDTGTRNLILTRPLDKESSEGEQGFLVNVRCKPRITSNPIDLSSSAKARSNSLDSTTIPVRIIVTDANDHAPEFVGPQPFIVNISETSPIGSVVSRDILAIDRDSAGPFSTLHYRVLDDGSAHSTLLHFANPLDPTLLVAGQLDYETLSSFVVTIIAQDQGEPEPLQTKAQVQVNVIDFDDQNPKFMDEKYTLIMDETQQNLVGQNLQVLPRNLYAEDGDKGINSPVLYSFDQIGNAFQQQSREDSDSVSVSVSAVPGSSQSSNSLIDEPNLNIEHYLHLNPSSGEIRLIRHWPNRWAGSPMTLVVRATQADNKDRYTLTTLTITRPVSSTSLRALDSLPKPNIKSENESGDIETATSGHSEISRQLETTTMATNFGLKFIPTDKLSVDVPENVAISEKIAKVRAKYQANTNALSNEQPDSALSEVVDLISESPILKQTGNSNNNRTIIRKSRDPPQQQQHQKRPINYQILDDQTDQFGINGLGDIFVKRSLDYEQRQVYKFRVLATYTKYSDICHVQVNVLNVNDNKPKFTQPLYTFHLTESRLKNSVIGVVSAHDADINDTLKYSISGEHEHLFDISQSGGQLNLKSNIRQLNITSCHLIVIATDSLKPAPNGFHSHQARVNVHVAPQLVGRSLNFGPTTSSDTTLNDNQLPNSRSLIDQQQQRPNDWSSASSSARFAGGTQVSRSLQTPSSSKETTPSNQRSSVATVMSSLQHMVRSVNFLEMPMSSALLLSALLAFLICLLFIVIISMSVHFYRRRMKQQRHRHRHLAAAAHLRHAHLSSALHQQVANQTAPTNHRFNNGSSNSLSLTNNSSPTNSTGADASPNYLSPHTSPSEIFTVKGSGFVSNNNNPSANELVVIKRPSQDISGGKPTVTRTGDVVGAPGNGLAKETTIQRISVATPASLNNNNVNSPNQHKSSRTNSRLSVRSPVNGGLVRGEAFNRIKSLSSNLQQDNSLISTISSHSKRSYRSNTTDDSSVMHCGHYSVNPEGISSPQLAKSGKEKSTTRSGSRERSIEAAIKSLVKESDSEIEDNNKIVENVKQRPLQQTKHLSQPDALIAEIKQHQVNEELSVLTNSKPGIKSYRKLPLSSLARQHNRVAPEEGVVSVRDSALASETSPASKLNNHFQQKTSISARDEAEAGLMAMIRNPERRIPKGTDNLISNFAQQDSIMSNKSNSSSNQNGSNEETMIVPRQNNIKWPQGAIPSRVKKLTWDDELSISNEDCFVAPELRNLCNNSCPISPLSNHQYPIEGTTNTEDHFAEQHFLFSNPCSPTLMSTDFNSSAFSAKQQQQQQQSIALQSIGNTNHLPELDYSSMIGQNNCFDYTIVQSSQFQVDAFNSNGSNHDLNNNLSTNHQSLSAQHHHLLQQQQHSKRPQQGASSYLYSNSIISNNFESNNQDQSKQQQRFAAPSSSTNQDLSHLMTTAVL